MADAASYAGAVAAIKARMVANWTTTPIAFQNEAVYDPAADTTAPWVYFEVLGNDSELRGAGNPASRAYIYRGHILAHVFVPLNTGTDLAHRYAAQIGEIFRSQGFYNDGQGSIVRTWSPRTDGGGSDADNGNWFRVTMTCPFEFLFQG